MEPSSSNRVRWVARFLVFWAVCVVCRLIQLQILQHDMYRQLAVAQQERVVDVPAPRGTILDREGEKLAMSVPCQSVCVNPMRIQDPVFAAELLARILGLDSWKLASRLKAASDSRQGFLWVKRKISDEEFDRLREWNLDWVEFRQESKRVYAANGVGAHVLGGVDFEENGNSGVELSFNNDLTGHAGAIRLVTDVRQRGWKSKLDREPAPGKQIQLTILARLQFIAERELKKAVEEHHCKSGTLVAMDPRTGEILAMASYPPYDPNVPPEPETEYERENLAVAAPFEPGSVFKVLTIATAIDTNPNIKPGTVVSCGNGSITLAGRTIHDHNSYSALPVEDVLARSSNIGAINIGLTIGDATMYQYLRRFGIGSRTGIALPGESAGLLRPLKRWEKQSSLASVSMGHEVAVTSVQLARLCSAIANGGYLVKPKLILGGTQEPPVRVLKPETAITMRHMMEGVVIKPWGTGYRYANIPGYSSGGKTGTAQIYDFKSHLYTHLYNASFMGFAPVNDPAVVVVATVNGTTGMAGYGGPVAAPVFREVAGAALRLLGVPRDLPDVPLPETGGSAADDNDVALTDFASSDPQPLVQGDAPDQRPFLAGAGLKEPAGIVGPKTPGFIGLTKREAVEESSQSGIQIDFEGIGLVHEQYPPPGAVMAPGQRVRLLLAR